MKKTIYSIFAGALALSAVTFSSCDDEEKLPQIDGYNNSNEVGKDNLVAHWTFDDTNNERLSNTAAAQSFGGTGFTTGQIGKALQLTKGALVYPEISAINTADALGNFTVSLWVNVTGTKRVAGGGGFYSFFGIIPTSVTDIWGNIHAAAEIGRHLPSSDTLELKNYLNTTLSTGAQSGQDNVALKNGDKGKYFMGANRWAHYVMTWDATTHKFEIYGDTEAVGGYTDRGTTPALKMRVPAKAVFGSVAASDIGFAGATRPDWAPMATASIDDVRVFNTVLSQAEITALFNLGTAGR
jgi:hypothetical protein